MFDLAVAGVTLLAALPLLAVVAVAVRLTMGAPILFRQIRAGHRGEPFTILKFRTMREGSHLSDGERLTSFGRLLRRTSLDELPQLWNVLRGDMSLVGPRPLLMEYLPLYSPEQARRHALRPGMTGWTQVNGRNALSWEEKFKLDVWYVDNRSLMLDLRILFMTAVKGFRSQGINQPGHETTEYFRGNG
jgi:lipopolysaccharide/colanic/teichoic acid biosynthesis glycosyltransferase